MTFLDLEESILEEFAGWAPVARSRARHDSLTVVRDDSKRAAWVWAQNERNKVARAKVRSEKRYHRSPCPRCGGLVTRESRNGRAKVPTYCSTRCARAARFARWYAKHGQERNVRRRVEASR